MKRITILTMSLAVALAACGPKENELEKAKTELANLKKKQSEIENEITELEKRIKELDTVAHEVIETLVTTQKPKTGEFTYYIKVPGRADSKQNIVVSTEGMGNVTSISVQEGNMVQKGQTIARIDNNVYAAQIDELKTRLELATEVFEKQERLWEQKVGSEIQYLQAKNNKESLEKSIKSLQVQAAKSIITAPISGYLDQVFIKEGQTVAMGTPAVRIVSLSKINLQCDVSEKYIGQISVKDSLKIYFPSINKKLKSRIKTIGQTVNQDNRTFLIEAEIDNKDGMIKPNVLADVTIPTYHNPKAIMVPTSVVQQGKDHDFVFVVARENGLMVAKKRTVTVGKNYLGTTEILEGIAESDEIVVLGGRLISDGEPIKVEQKL